MKKVISLILTIAMCMTLCIPALASEDKQDVNVETLNGLEYYIEETEMYRLVLCKHDDGRMEVAFLDKGTPDAILSAVYTPNNCTYTAVKKEVLSNKVPFVTIHMPTTYSLPSAQENIIINDCIKKGGKAYPYRTFRTVKAQGYTKEYTVELKQMREYFVEEYETFYTLNRTVAELIVALGGSTSWVGMLGLAFVVKDGINYFTSDHVIKVCYCFPTTRKAGFVNSKKGITENYWEKYRYVLDTNNLKYICDGKEENGTGWSENYFNEDMIAKLSAENYEAVWG